MSISSGPSSIPTEVPSESNPQWNLAVNTCSEEDEEVVEEDEEEIDELASASEPDEEMPLETTGGPRHPGRVPGQTLLPAVKIENILQADGVTGSLALSREGLYVLSIATEEFIKRLVQGGHRQANTARRNAINYRDMADTTRQYQEFMFLKDIIPYPMTLADALELREAKEKDPFGEDLGVLPSNAVSTSAPQRMSTTKSKPKHVIVNGKANGSSSRLTSEASASTNATRSHGGQVMTWGGQAANVLDARPWTHWTDPQTQASVHQELNGQTNGHVASSSSVSRSGTVTPIHTDPSPSQSHDARPPAPPADVWPGPYAGPASGFLQGPGHNPGRTIYTQEPSR